MTTESKGWKRRQRRALASALVLFTILAVVFGLRRPWVRPLPGMRIEPTRPIRQASDFGPASGYALLVDAIAEPKGADPLTRIWADSWQDAGVKLERHPWPTELPPAMPAAGPGQPSLKKRAPWTLDQCRDIERLAALHEPKVALLARALAASDLRVPSAISSTARMSYMSRVRIFTEWLCIDAQRHAAIGDYRAAIRDIDRILGMSNAICRGGSLFSVGVARNCVGDAADATWLITTRYSLPEADLVALAKSFLTHDEQSEPLAEVFRHEVLAAKETAAEVYRRQSLRWVGSWGPGPGSSPTLKTVSSLAFALARATGSSYSATARNLDNCYRQLITFTERPYSAAVDAEFRDFIRGLAPSRVGHSSLFFRTRDPIGLICASPYASACEGVLVTAACRDATLRGMAAFCAVKAYQAKHGRLPKTLAELVPDYLPNVPTDPFDGKPLRYLRNHVPGLPAGAWAVYSISQGFVDEGGTAYSAGSLSGKRVRNPDLVWPSQPYPEKMPAK